MWLLGTMDPIGTSLRKPNRLHRRIYRSKVYAILFRVWLRSAVSLCTNYMYI